MHRRTVVIALVALIVTAVRSEIAQAAAQSSAVGRPNILWITAEDLSPDLGCYGAPNARTPNLDQFAAEGARFTSMFSISGVCAPSRSAIITGMYPTTIGTHHMRSKGVPPSYVRCFTEYLRAAGYYCTNNSKTDYNFDAPVTAWDESGGKAHWRNRPEGQPFFSVFNIGTTHESRIRVDDKTFAELTKRLKPEDRHDPEDCVLPPYYPDTPVVRRDWANYEDLITAMDLQVRDFLDQLEEDGLADNTIVFFYGDHGRGLPRAKRWIYDSGLHVPLIVCWPGKIQPGTVRDDLVSFIDLAPTMLSIIGYDIQPHMQGRAFLGNQKREEPQYIFAARDRMDETYDIIRAVRDKRFKYIRNFQPGKPYAQYIGYLELMPTMQEMRRLNKAGTLTGAERQYFQPEKPVEELYDLEADPHEVNNLADDWRYQRRLATMREVLDEWMEETGDLGLTPEPELLEQMRPGGQWRTTRKPGITGAIDQHGKLSARISCPTRGASVAYTTDKGNKPHWLLYHNQPLEFDTPVTLRAKAIRLGYKESEVVTMDLPER